MWLLIVLGWFEASNDGESKQWRLHREAGDRKETKNEVLPPLKMGYFGHTVILLPMSDFC